MSNLIVQLRASITATTARMRAIHERPRTRTLRPSEQAEFDALEREVMRLNIQILEARLLACEEVLARIDQQVTLHWGTPEARRRAALKG